jgi:hypothetical protein
MSTLSNKISTDSTEELNESALPSILAVIGIALSIIAIVLSGVVAGTNPKGQNCGTGADGFSFEPRVPGADDKHRLRRSPGLTIDLVPNKLEPSSKVIQIPVGYIKSGKKFVSICGTFKLNKDVEAGSTPITIGTLATNINGVVYMPAFGEKSAGVIGVIQIFDRKVTFQNMSVVPLEKNDVVSSTALVPIISN